MESHTIRQNAAPGTVLITGSSGLIGTALRHKLEGRGRTCIGVDWRSAETAFSIDIRDTERLARLLSGVTGIVHLAAVSRVIEGERDPALCRAINVDATRGILEAALAGSPRPWLIYASSREVYGHQYGQRVREDAPFQPLNVYARSKVDAEDLVNSARSAGLQTAIVRFSSVYGSAEDYADRVVPAFIASAVRGRTLRLDGKDCRFDFTHVDDISLGLMRLINRLDAGDRALPPIHYVSGEGVTLLELAEMARAAGDPQTRLVEAPPRAFDVHEFVGDPSRAKALLDWQVTTPLRSGLERLAADFRRIQRSSAES